MELSVDMMQKLELILSIAGLVVVLTSGVASILNHIIRVKTSKGEEVGKALTTAASILNFVSVNLDKGIQLAKMTTGKPVPQTITVPNPVAALPAAVPAPKPTPTEPPAGS